MNDSADTTTERRGFWYRAWGLYADGFRGMGPLGRSLWLLIILKVVILLVVMKLLFFPNLLSRDYSTDDERSDAVRHSLLDPRRK